jgi:hypothetical protein
MAIKIVKEKQSKNKINPYYILKYNYMIGDANLKKQKYLPIIRLLKDMLDYSTS